MSYDSVENKTDMERIFTEIYRKRLWGGGKGEYYSGRGSENYNTEKYRQYLQKFILDRNVSSVVDIGCGDYRLASQVDWKGVKYTGIDVVGELIRRNNALYSTNNISFIRKDITHDDLPSADLCLVRQVLQHLSNKHILEVLSKLTNYQYVLITDGLPVSAPRQKNVDKPTDYNNRWNHLYRSGLYLEAPPFNLKAKVVLSYLDRAKIEEFRTILIDRTL